ncbi:MAG TPA: hypothetical protein PKN96_11970 [Flavobacterium sp.]|uniref:hypothetical protein n=1 Tax=Flavobacterium sp. TaxID=239 RepID=UPI002D143B30|nr:hypothetical protein [Flavobacterium sp.]HNP34000.1 hypothetical protein [Flavobacterium sp.]
MTEKEWVKSIITDIEKMLRQTDDNVRVVDGHRLSYANEVLTYGKDNKPDEQKSVGYETDILIYEQLDDTTWKPRVVIETKLGSVTTHDAITYSQKAQTHKYVHPYLRYGILIGDREHHPLPGRLFRHGQHFDFMLSWKSFRADKQEMKRIAEIVNDEIQASKTLDEILFNSRSKDRDKFTSLHRPLKLYNE